MYNWHIDGDIQDIYQVIIIVTTIQINLSCELRLKNNWAHIYYTNNYIIMCRILGQLEYPGQVRFINNSNK